ncbi:ABC transporter permease [Pontibacter chitinilyticus]|uniref:ABC transporter permease n=1 Tax=Pontibacter chitinilyticus TaxID=2674989 RepID=UPI00321A18E5
MHKIWLIVQREYITRVRKKSFIVMTLVTPLLLAVFMVLPGLLIAMSGDSSETIMLLDESGLFANKLESKNDLKIVPITGTLEQAKQIYKETDNTALLYIPNITLDNPTGIRIFSKKNTNLQTKVRLENMLEKEVENQRLIASGLNRELLKNIKANISVASVNLGDEGEKDNNAFVTSGAGVAGAFVIYFFIFLYGVQIMRGIIEEKTSRIVEVIISSVKPFQLMMGKILGIAAVGLTQFLLWVVLSLIVVTGVKSAFDIAPAPTPMEQLAAGQAAAAGEAPDQEEVAAQKDGASAMVADTLTAINNLNLPLILGCFLFYFLGGYLLYGSLFGAIGSAVDNETDTQQFMFPITIPLILSFILSYSLVLKNPDGPVSFWLSIIPFTSPIVMMVRVPFGVPAWQLVLSMSLLVLGFIFTTWLASRIYRVGILMYGKKISYKELSKWLFYRI